MAATGQERKATRVSQAADRMFTTMCAKKPPSDGIERACSVIDASKSCRITTETVPLSEESD